MSGVDEADPDVVATAVATAVPGSVASGVPGDILPIREAPAPEEDLAVAVLLGLVEAIRALRTHPVGQPTLRTTLTDHQLAGRHVVALLHVALRGPLTVTDLADGLGVARTTASLLVAELADAGLVDRSPDQRDRRRTVVTVAAGHRSDVDRVVAARLQPLRRTIDRLGADTMTTVATALAVLADELRRPPCTPR